MALVHRIGLGVGTLDGVAERAQAARECGAQLVRLRFTLGERGQFDSRFLETARQGVAAIRSTGLEILGVIDGDLTVAPLGAGAFADGEPGPLAQAWVAEMRTHARGLAMALGDQVTAWELLPGPNGDPPRIAPGRWVDLVNQLAAELRAATPSAAIITGSLISDEMEDGVAYLRAAMDAAESKGLWTRGEPPFDALGLSLRILPDGGASEEAVSAAVRDRVGRLWRVMAQTADATSPPPIAVTGVAWSAARAGESVQARNLWTALDALTSDAAVVMAIWDSLQDSGVGTDGLCARSDLAAHRPAWQAYHDFALYYRQIGGAAAGAWQESLTVADTDMAPEPELFPPEANPAAQTLATGWEAAPGAESLDTPADTAPGEDSDLAAIAVPEDLEPEVFPPPLPLIIMGATAAATAATEIQVGGETSGGPEAAGTEATAPLAVPAAVAASAVVLGASDRDASDPAPAGADPGPGTGTPLTEPHSEPDYMTLRIPSAEALLRAAGLDGLSLATALSELATLHGDLSRLTPGEYRLPLAPPAAPPAGQTYTNQQIISALYRAGGGSWALFERTGLVLGELAARRNDVYGGPPFEAMEGLTAVERQAIGAELASLAERT